MTIKSDAGDGLLIVVPGVIWGASFLFIAEGLEAMGPYGVTFTRILIGFLTLALFARARKPIPRKDWLAVAAVGVTWMAFPLSMFPFAEQHVSSAVTGMLNGAVPLFTAIVAAFIARGLPSRGVLMGIGVGMAGAVLMALPSLGAGRSSAMGVGMIMAALVSYGFATNIARPLQQRHGALPVIWRAQAVGLVLTAPMGAPQLLHAHWSLGPLLSMLTLGAFGTAIAMVITTVAAGRLGATKAAATAFLIPPVALLLGVLVRHEHVAPAAVLGGLVCVGGAWIMRRAQSEVVARVTGGVAPIAPSVARGTA